jgi:hypothetical protein
LQNESGIEGDKSEDPPALVFVGGSQVSVAFGDGPESLGNTFPIAPVTDIPPLSEAASVNPPFLSPSDTWFIETKKVMVKTLLRPLFRSSVLNAVRTLSCSTNTLLHCALTDTVTQELGSRKAFEPMCPSWKSVRRAPADGAYRKCHGNCFWGYCLQLLEQGVVFCYIQQLSPKNIR